ncbi:hypothetical protein BJV77DRAFT_1071579 [Russula vinacea]|nr:hypothetical protein BJV77DRAFT_1071579 [Russula vinacea]
MPKITPPLSYYPPLPTNQSLMIPLSRKPSFPPPPPPPYHHKRNFKLSPEDLQVLGLQPLPTLVAQPQPRRHAAAFMERPSTPLPRTPSPSLSSAVDVDMTGLHEFSSRQRSLSQGHSFVPESRGRPPPSPPQSVTPSPSTSASPPGSGFASAYTSYTSPPRSPPERQHPSQRIPLPMAAIAFR